MSGKQNPVVKEYFTTEEMDGGFTADDIRAMAPVPMGHLQGLSRREFEKIEGAVNDVIATLAAAYLEHTGKPVLNVEHPDGRVFSILEHKPTE